MSDIIKSHTTHIIKKVKKLKYLVSKTLNTDRYNLKKQLYQLNFSSKEENLKKQVSEIEKNINTSIEQALWRKKNKPTLTYDFNLPITSKKDEIIETIKNNQIVIISGETGSGKTTQIPKMCIEAGQGIYGLIGCTQPRRIAAITVANRIAAELGETIGNSVTYKIRFMEKKSKNPFIKIMTDGILLAETQSDHWLNEYDTIIIDEAHERSLNIDFTLGILKNLLKKRKNLKLIITSATIDTEKFSKAFDNAPIIEVSGRMYPVDVIYMPLEQDKEQSEETTYVEQTIYSIEKLYQETLSGDILVFMPTEQDIKETCELIDSKQYSNLIALPLFARLGAAEQSKVFETTSKRKIIVATNVAETSITIPGIKYVIDTGLARISQYSPRSRTTSLPVTKISKSSADQRKGRCGRIENGICIRLFDEKDYEQRQIFTLPEILRANLAEVILRMLSLKLYDIENFPFIDKPSPKSIKDGFDILIEIDAISKISKKDQSVFRLTQKGKIMATLPLDPQLSRMLIQGKEEGCLNEMAVIVSALTIKDPRERPIDHAKQADQKHELFKDHLSDFITLLNIWNKYHLHKNKVKSINQMKKFCKENFLSFRRMREFRDIYNQIISILEESGFIEQNKIKSDSDYVTGAEFFNTPQDNNFSPLYIAIHKSILSGYLSNIAEKKEGNIFKATKSREAMIFPGSGLFNCALQWIVAAEMVETSRLFARTVANIDNSWLEQIGQSLCKYSYSEPHWEKNRGEVIGYEQVSLFGLIIVAQRKVSYGKINPIEANDIFIQKALVEKDVKIPFNFMKENSLLIDNAKNMEDKIRKRDVLISEHDMFLFYKQRLPENIYEIRSLQKFLKNIKNENSLKMKQDDILRYMPEQDELALFPDSMKLGEQSFECDYKFSPDKKDDGVTIKIPSHMANVVPLQALNWTVPGLYKEKITALIKNLPKEYRRELVPISKSVDIIIDEMPKFKGDLVNELSNFIKMRFKVNISASAWEEKSLPEHLKMRISITDQKGKELKSSRDKTILTQIDSFESDENDFENIRKNFEKKNIVSWDFGDIKESVILYGKNKWIVFPGIVAKENSVCLSIFKTKAQAIKSHKKGVCKLFELHFSKELKKFKKNLVIPKKTKNKTNYFGGEIEFIDCLHKSILNDIFCVNICCKKDFDNYAQKTSSMIFPKAMEMLQYSVDILESYHDTRILIYNIETSTKLTDQAVHWFNEIRNDLEKLVPDNFLLLYNSERLFHINRYIQAVKIRVQRGFDDFNKDVEKSKQLEIFQNILNVFIKEISSDTSEAKKQAIENFFWLIQEYKVSIFAQELKTAVKVSAKRLEKVAQEIKTMV